MLQELHPPAQERRGEAQVRGSSERAEGPAASLEPHFRARQIPARTKQPGGIPALSTDSSLASSLCLEPRRPRSLCDRALQMLGFPQVRRPHRLLWLRLAACLPLPGVLGHRRGLAEGAVPSRRPPDPWGPRGLGPGRLSEPDLGRIQDTLGRGISTPLLFKCLSCLLPSAGTWAPRGVGGANATGPSTTAELFTCSLFTVRSLTQAFPVSI